MNSIYLRNKFKHFDVFNLSRLNEEQRIRSNLSVLNIRTQQGHSKKKKKKRNNFFYLNFWYRSWSNTSTRKTHSKTSCISNFYYNKFKCKFSSSSTTRKTDFKCISYTRSCKTTNIFIIWIPINQIYRMITIIRRRFIVKQNKTSI